jgi:hypothetical protein
MELTVQIPDDLASRMGASPVDLSRRLLSFGNRYELDAFLKAHDVYDDYTMEDLEQQLEGLRRLGI